MATEDAAARAALDHVFKHIDSDNCQVLLLAIGRRSDSQEKVERFQAVEVISRRLLEAAQEYHRPLAAEWANLWANLAKGAAEATWKRLGLSASALTPADELEPTVLIDFMNDVELMGIVGLEPGWAPDLKRVDKELEL